LLRLAAARFPLKPAAVFPRGLSITFQQLDRRSDQLAARLQRCGIGLGQRVAILCGNSPSALVGFWGVQKTGAATVDISTQLGLEALSEILDEAAPQALIASAAQVQKVMRGAGGNGCLETVITDATVDETAESTGRFHFFEHIYESESESPAPLDAKDGDVAMIIYTSGSTGRPKGVMLTHRNLLSNITASVSLMHLDDTERILVVVPLFYIHGRMQLLIHALIGGTLVFSAGFLLPQGVLKELLEQQVTSFSGVPFHFKSMLERTSMSATQFPALRYVLITGGALSAAELKELAAALPGVAIHSAYGQTEASPRITYMSPKDIRTKPTSCGRAIPTVLVEIVDDEGHAVPPGEIGEVAASGPNIMAGYVSGDERTSGVIDDKGRLRTGDLGWLDDAGYLFLAGRKSEMIKTAGERVFPGESEAIIRALATVRDAVVVGVPDPRFGEKLIAFVVAKGNDTRLSESELRSHCLQALPFVRVPREFHVLAELPRTGSGKPDRQALRKLAEARRGSASAPNA